MVASLFCFVYLIKKCYNKSIMKNVINLLIILCCVLVVSCCSVPIDDTPKWTQNNRYALEMTTTCNTSKHSVGISGCAFKGSASPSLLTFPPLYKGSISFSSYGCASPSYNIGSDTELNIPVNDLYNSGNLSSICSYSIIRTFDKIKKQDVNGIIQGRFLVKIIPDTSYTSLLALRIQDEVFNGVAWLQRKYAQTTKPSVYVHPIGQEGTFLMYCEDSLILKTYHTATPFKLDIPEGTSCDYELHFINKDNQYMEYATLIYEEQGYTEDIKIPNVSLHKSGSKKYIEFSFDHDRNLKGKPMVYGISINGYRCEGQHYCKVINDRSIYIVRAVTTTGRFFYGEYSPQTNTWRTK